MKMDRPSELVSPSEYEFPTLLENVQPVPVVEKMTSILESEKNTDLLLLSSEQKKPSLSSIPLMRSNVESHQHQFNTVPPVYNITDSSDFQKSSGSSGHTWAGYSKIMMEQGLQDCHNEQYYKKLGKDHLKMFFGSVTTEKNIPENGKLYKSYQTIDQKMLLIKKYQEKKQQIPPKFVKKTAAVIEKIPTSNKQQGKIKNILDI